MVGKDYSVGYPLFARTFFCFVVFTGVSRSSNALHSVRFGAFGIAWHACLFYDFVIYVIASSRDLVSTISSFFFDRV